VIWALVGGFILITDAIRLRRAHQREIADGKEEVA
jgi:hypothetical protein